ncbi:MAG: hypothetical protein V2A66_05860, partial [Pseudomonadota bacterium]
MPPKNQKPDKAARHESKGDSHLADGKPKRAIEEYKKALAVDPERRYIYDKLVDAMDRLPGEWGLKEFAESVSLTMKKQELENPPIKQVHAKLS